MKCTYEDHHMDSKIVNPWFTLQDFTKLNVGENCHMFKLIRTKVDKAQSQHTQQQDNSLRTIRAAKAAFNRDKKRSHRPLNSMFGTITFSQIPVSVLPSANSCLYAGRSATDARNWIALLTSCNISTMLLSSTVYHTYTPTPLCHTVNIYSVSQKKVAPLKLFAIFSVLVNLCN